MAKSIPKGAKTRRPAGQSGPFGNPEVPRKPRQTQVLRADPEKYPNVSRNPGLERALRIQQALAQGRSRDEAVALADAAMGPRMASTGAKPSRPRRRRKT